MQVYCYDSDLNPYQCRYTVNLLEFSTRIIAHKLKIQDYECIYDITIENGNPGSGYCFYEHDPHDNEQCMHIEISKSDEQEMIRTLAHEMVHAQQYLTGQLRSETQKIRNQLCSINYWHGKKYACKVDVEPWEKQAYSQEYQLMKQTLTQWRYFMDYVFDYRTDLTPMGNFNLWYDLNCRERDAFNEQMLPRDLAKNIFCQQYNIAHLTE